MSFSSQICTTLSMLLFLLCWCECVCVCFKNVFFFLHVFFFYIFILLYTVRNVMHFSYRLPLSVPYISRPSSRYRRRFEDVLRDASWNANEKSWNVFYVTWMWAFHLTKCCVINYSLFVEILLNKINFTFCNGSNLCLFVCIPNKKKNISFKFRLTKNRLKCLRLVRNFITVLLIFCVCFLLYKDFAVMCKLYTNWEHKFQKC